MKENFKMAYQVFDNGKPADTSAGGSCSRMSKGIGWDNSKFETLDQAINYCFDYLGQYGQSLKNVNRIAVGIIFMNGYEYSGSTDRIQIKEVK
jgi:hypothetical protein